MNKLYKVVFSPTGTSQLVTEKIAESFGTEGINIDLCEEISKEIKIDKDSICIFSAPCYGGRIPKLVAERLSKISSKGARTIVCVTYGNRAFEDSLIELSDCVESNGFNIIAGCAVIGEHNIMHIYGKNRPDTSDLNEIKEFSNKVVEKIKNNTLTKPDFPGNHPYKELHSGKTDILVDENTCINCGLCSSKCPTKAISPDGLTLDKNLCINCMRCIKICPKNSRSISKEFVDMLITRVGKACEERKENQFYL